MRRDVPVRACGLTGAKRARARKKHTCSVSCRVLLGLLACSAVSAASADERLAVPLSSMSNFPRRDDSRSALASAHLCLDPPAAAPRQRSSARCVAAASSRARRTRAVALFLRRFVAESARSRKCRVDEPASRRARRRGGRSPTEPRSSARGRAYTRDMWRKARTRASPPLATEPTARPRRREPRRFSGTPSARRSGSGSPSDARFRARGKTNHPRTRRPFPT